MYKCGKKRESLYSTIFGGMNMRKISLLMMLAIVSVSLAAAGIVSYMESASGDTYWNPDPIRIYAQQGVTTNFFGYYEDTVALTVYNAGPQAVTVKKVTINGNAGRIGYGDTVIYDPYGHMQVAYERCSDADNAASNCNIPVGANRRALVQAGSINTCNQGEYWAQSINSLRASNTATVTVYFDRGSGIEQETSRVSFSCFDNWLCKMNSQCESRYGQGRQCYQGGCINPEP